MKNPLLKSHALAMVAAVPVLLAGCQQPNEFLPPPPPEVTVARPVQKEITNYLESTGRTEEAARVDLRPRVSGYLESVHFSDGDLVKKGQLLFVIDPRPFEAQLEMARAQLAQATAEFENARSLFERTENLFDQGATTDKDLTEKRAARDKALASIAAAEAAVRDASLSLGFTRIRAPMDGRIGEREVDVGNLVGAGENTLLATIFSYNPIYAYFTLSEREVLSLIERSKSQRTDGADPEELATAYLGLANEEGHPHEGILEFADLGVDPRTGAMRLRAVFENRPIKYPDIVPGLFARIRIPVNRVPDALLVPERAISTDQSGKHLLTVDDEDAVHKKKIRVGSLIDGMRVVEEGVGPDDWVVIEGIQKARPGAKAAPHRVDIAHATGASAPNESGSAPRTLLGNPPTGDQ